MVTIRSRRAVGLSFDGSNLILSMIRFDFDEEIYRACLIVNQSLYDIYIDPNEVVRQTIVKLLFSKDFLRIFVFN